MDESPNPGENEKPEARLGHFLSFGSKKKKGCREPRRGDGWRCSYKPLHLLGLFHFYQSGHAITNDEHVSPDFGIDTDMEEEQEVVVVAPEEKERRPRSLWYAFRSTVSKCRTQASRKWWRWRRRK
jgi:hypothetical protein